MQYRRAVQQDFDKIVALHTKYLAENLSSAQKKYGFFLTAYSREDFVAMDNSLYVAVCLNEHELCGYLGVSQPEFNLSSPIFSKITNALSQYTYQGKSIAQTQYFMVNQLCVDETYRHQQIPLTLCQHVLHGLPKDYDLAITFAARENKRSVAFIKSLGFSSLDQLNINERIFCLFYLDREQMGRMRMSCHPAVYTRDDGKRKF